MGRQIPTEQDRARKIGPASTVPLGIVRESGLVAAGGALGSLAGAAIASLVASPPGAVVLETQIVNGLGALALGFFLARLERRGPRPHLRPFLAVGVLGSFTTYSTLIADARTLADGRFVPAAFAYVGCSMAVGIAAFVLGRRLEGRFARTRVQPERSAP